MKAILYRFFILVGAKTQKQVRREAVIFLARRQIRRYAKEQVGTSFLRWCLLRTCELNRVFVATQRRYPYVCRGRLGRNVIFA